MSLAMAASVRLAEGRLVVANVRFAAADVVTAAADAERRGLPLDVWLDGVVRAGVAAVSVAGAGADLARVEQALTGVAGQVQASVDAAMHRLTTQVAAVSEPTTGDLAVAAQAAVDRLARGVASLLLGDRAPVPAWIQRSVEAATGQALAEIQRSLAATTASLQHTVAQDREAVAATVTAATTSLASQVGTALTDLRGVITTAEQVAHTQARTNRPGLEYERSLADALGVIAANAGDGGATFVGGTAGRSGGKTGDVCVTYSSGHVLVAEAKLRGASSSASASSALTVDAWRRELAAARVNRSAIVALGTTRPELMPVPGQRLILLGQTDMVLGWDDRDPADDQFLLVAYLCLRKLAEAHGPGDSTDAAAAVAEITVGVRALQEALTSWNDLDKHAAAAMKSTTAVATCSKQLRETVTARVQALVGALTPRQATELPSDPSSGYAA